MISYNKLTEELKANIVKKFYEKESLSNISTSLDISNRAVRRVLKEAGIETRKRNRYTLNENYFENIDSENKAYWLGFIYADGFVGDEKTNNIVIALSISDEEHLLKFKETINFTGELRIGGKGGYKNSKEKIIINFSSKKMAKDLRKLGLYPGKSLTMKCFPEIPKSLIRHFIRGYFDGDGSIYSYKKKFFKKLSNNEIKEYEYERFEVSIIGTDDFVKEIQKHLPSPSRIRPSKTEGMSYFETTGSKSAYEIQKYFYENSSTYLNRKKNKFDLLSPLT